MRGTTLIIALFTLIAFAGCKRATYFDCGDGYEVPARTVCNGVRDCYNGADEEMCYPHWVCGSGELISPFNLCDGQEHCADGSDEVYEDRGGPCVYEERFVIACGPSKVLDQEYVCDTVPDCPGGVDERHCTSGNTYLCDDFIHAVYPDQVCNGVRDCPDGSDERYCS